MRRVLWLLLAPILVLSGCVSEPQPQNDKPLRVAWRQASLPVPPDAAGRLAVRDAARCQDQWYVVGAVVGDGGESRPAAWRSGDGRVWTHLTFEARDHWARRQVLFSVACRGGRAAMIGAKSGGAHGNLRFSTWYPRSDGVFVDVRAALELYGGPRGVGVGRLAAGEAGWMIAGSRTDGAAVWLSEDATRFEIVDSDPQLSSDAAVNTRAGDLTYARGAWTLVGGASRRGRVAGIPMAWVSEDGRAWRRQKVPYGKEHTDLHRVVPHRGRVLAAGVAGAEFGVWRRDRSRWRRAGGFGALDPKQTSSPAVTGLASTGGGVAATVDDGARYRLWASPDGARWRHVATPTAPRSGGESAMTAAGADGQLLLLADDGAEGRVWLAQSVRYR